MDAGKSLREHGLSIGELEPGPAASIADVEGVAVGHVTVAGTGVTAVLPGPIERLGPSRFPQVWAFSTAPASSRARTRSRNGA